MQQNAGQAQAMPETEAVPAGKRPGARNERLNVRDFVTIAVLTVLELVVYFSIGMIAGSTPIGWCFTLGIQAIPLGIIFMLMYAKVNKRGVVLISGVLVGLLVGMSFWLTGLVIALGALARLSGTSPTASASPPWPPASRPSWWAGIWARSPRSCS